MARAREIVATTVPVAALIDVGLPDGDGIDLVRWLRLRWPALPVVVITGEIVPNVIYATYRLDAVFLPKPVDVGELSRFLSGIGRGEHRAAVGIERAFERTRTESHLADREYELLRWVDAGNEVASFAAHAGISENTVKDYSRRLLAKTSQPNVRALVLRIRAGAWRDDQRD